MKKIIKNILKVSFLLVLPAIILLTFATYLIISKGISFLTTNKKEYETSIAITELSDLASINSADYMNSLMLSPFWYVHKENDVLVASARSLDIDVDKYDLNDDDFFLFEDLKLLLENNATNPLIIRNGAINETGGTKQFDENTYTPGYTYSLEVNIINKKRKSNNTCDITFGTCQLPVYKNNSFGKIGEQFSSTLILTLSDDLYLEIKEVSPDKERTRTKRVIKNIAAELFSYTTPERTCQAMTDQDSPYKNFLQTLFQSTNDPAHLERRPDIQDRFTFYGYVQNNLLTDSQLPVNIMISNEEVCSGECTNSSRRLQKAEYLGKLHCEGFPHFFNIEDNAIYLTSEQDLQFGHFSGNDQFSAEVSLRQSENTLYSQQFDDFTGWER